MNTVSLLKDLIRFKTINPPGNEGDCIRFIDNTLKEAGFKTSILGKAENRLNLITRLEGTGDAPPFLMQGHVDVVPVDGQQWDNDPFEGIVADDCIWGRGALDMKGGIAMMISALMMAKSQGLKPKGDIILAVVCDEEDEGDYGANYLVKEHPELFNNVKYSIGEIGGFTTYIGSQKLYPIMVSEKQVCSLRIVLKGSSGHGSMPIRDGSMSKLGKLLNSLNRKRFPVHVTNPTEYMIKAMAEALPFPKSLFLKQLLNPSITDKVLDILSGNGKIFDSVLHNTASPTIVRGGNKINVIPGEVEIELDGRILPGLKPDTMIKELHQLAGIDMDIEITKFIPGPEKVDMSLFSTLSKILVAADTDAKPVPIVISGSTDARYFSKLGIQTYGFTPMLLPRNFNFSELIHAANERIPIKALEFGTAAIFELIKRL